MFLITSNLHSACQVMETVISEKLKMIALSSILSYIKKDLDVACLFL